MGSIAPPVVALALALFASGCGGSSDPASPSSESFPAAPYSTVVSQTSKLSIEVRTSPNQPLDRGECAVLYTIKTDANVLVEGLDITVTPWMPAMGHGASVRPTVSAEGSGRYVVDNLDLFMPGLWQLETSISGTVKEQVTPTVEVR